MATKFDASETDDARGFVFDTSKIGKPKIVAGRVEWEPPAGLDQTTIELVRDAIRHCNAGIEGGVHIINEHGEVE